MLDMMYINVNDLMHMEELLHEQENEILLQNIEHRNQLILKQAE